VSKGPGITFLNLGLGVSTSFQEGIQFSCDWFEFSAPFLSIHLQNGIAELIVHPTPFPPPFGHFVAVSGRLKFIWFPNETAFETRSCG
jgi:hypothetical protein